MLSFQQHRFNREQTKQVAQCCLDLSVFFKILYNFLELYRIKDAVLHEFNAGSYFVTISQRVIYAFNLKCKSAELSLIQSWSSEADTL